MRREEIKRLLKIAIVVSSFLSGLALARYILAAPVVTATCLGPQLLFRHLPMWHDRCLLRRERHVLQALPYPDADPHPHANENSHANTNENSYENTYKNANTGTKQQW